MRKLAPPINPPAYPRTAKTDHLMPNSADVRIHHDSESP